MWPQHTAHSTESHTQNPPEMFAGRLWREKTLGTQTVPVLSLNPLLLGPMTLAVGFSEPQLPLGNGSGKNASHSGHED